MTCAEDIVVPDDYPTEAPIPARLHYHGKIALTVFMIYAHGRFVYFGKRIALFTQRDGQFQLRGDDLVGIDGVRSEEHTSELQSLMRISYAVFCLKTKRHMNDHSPPPDQSTRNTKHNN